MSSIGSISIVIVALVIIFIFVIISLLCRKNQENREGVKSVILNMESLGEYVNIEGVQGQHEDWKLHSIKCHLVFGK